MDTAVTLTIEKIIAAAAKRRASYIHLTVGAYPTLRIDEELIELKDEPLVNNDFLKQIIAGWLSAEQKKELEQKKEIIFIKEVGKSFRLRVHIFYQKNLLSASLRLISAQIPTLADLGLPKAVFGLTEKKTGLIIIIGPYGSGRTTTVASFVEEINKSRKENIVTIERPIEYLLANKESLVEQREVGRDANSFTDALKYAQQTDVDVVVVDATPETEIMPLVLDFANSDRLALLIMDTTNAIQTIEEIFASFPSGDRAKSQLLLADSLLAIINQRLVPKVGGGLALVAEVLIANETVRALIRDGRLQQLAMIIQTSRAEGMISLDQNLAELVKAGKVLIDKAIEYADDPDNFRKIARV